MKLVFTHIPKTAGTSFRAWLESAIGRENIFWYGEDGLMEQQTPESLKGYRAIGGHFPVNYSIIQELEDIVGRSNLLYATSVREPHRQLLSHFNYIATTPENSVYSGDTLEEALQPGTPFFEVQKNFQCNYLSEDRSFSGFLRWKHGRQVEWAATEDINLLCARLAEKLDVNCAAVPYENVTPTSYEHLIDNNLVNEYVQKYCAEDQALYHAAKTKHI